MFYADKWFATENLNLIELTEYEFWLAHYTGATKENITSKTSDYSGKYEMWQFTNKGQVDGIIGNVDFDIKYINK